MSFVLKDRVMEASVFTGLGNVILDGPLEGYDDFASEIGEGNETWVLIEAVDANGDATGEWEACLCTLTGGELVRGTVFDSSDDGNPVNFSAGIKRVWCNVPAQKLALLNSAPGSGTVTEVSVVTANGFQGSVANPNTTPAITISIANAATVRTSLGLGTAALNNTGDFDPAGSAAAAQAASQPLDATLTALAGLTIAANSLTIGTGPDAFTQTAFGANTFPARSSAGNLEAKAVTDFALTFLDDLDAATMLGTIGAQPLDATLTALANLTIAANTLTIGTGVDTFSQVAFGANTFPARGSAGNLEAKTVTDFALTFLDDVNAGAALATLGAQPLDGTLTAFGALTIAANSITLGTGADAFTQLTLGANTFLARSSAGDAAAKTITDFGLSILDDANAAAVRTTIDAQQLNGNLTSLAGLTFTGNGLKGVRVNGAGNALELATIAAGLVTIANDDTLAASVSFAWVPIGDVPGDLPVKVSTNRLQFTPSTGDLVISGSFGCLGLLVNGNATSTTSIVLESIDVGETGETTGEIRLKGSTSGTVTLKTASVAGTYTLVLPTTDGAADQVLKTNGTGTLDWVDQPTGTVPDLIVLEHQEAQGTDGGTFTSGADRTATLNTEVSDAGGHCTLSGNQFTLAAGTYRIRAWTSGYNCSLFRGWLYNVTDAANVLLGTSTIGPAGTNVSNISMIEGEFTIASSKAFEIRKRCVTTSTTTGYGRATNLVGVEIYTRVYLEKVA